MQKIISTIAISLMLASCSNAIKQKVGLETAAPDEQLVEKQRPLYVPPHYELPEPPAFDANAAVKKKSSWMFWKKDKVETDQKIKVKSEESLVQSKPKKQWFWQKDKAENAGSAAHKIENSSAQPKKKKYFWQREKKASAIETK